MAGGDAVALDCGAALEFVHFLMLLLGPSSQPLSFDRSEVVARSSLAPFAYIRDSMDDLSNRADPPKASTVPDQAAAKLRPRQQDLPQ